ncbi:MAG: hypothetical protein Q7R47_05895 [Candidatus Diapherotrites archaeon]|nr:hypothetical protein [Candidatus Diapherotrites archaeon]
MKKLVLALVLVLLLAGCTTSQPQNPPAPSGQNPDQNTPVAPPSEPNPPVTPPAPIAPLAQPKPFSTAAQDTVLHFSRSFSTITPGVINSTVSVSQTADVRIKGHLKEVNAPSYERSFEFADGTLTYSIHETIDETTESCHQTTTITGSKTVSLSDSSQLLEPLRFRYEPDGTGTVNIELQGYAEVPTTENYVAQTTSTKTDCSDSSTDSATAQIELLLTLTTTDLNRTGFRGTTQFRESVPEPNSVTPNSFPVGMELRPSTPWAGSLNHFSLSNAVLEEKIAQDGVWQLDWDVQLPQ